MRRATDTTAMLSELVEFQSTFSVRRATRLRAVGERLLPISIHVLREESDSASIAQRQERAISIHVLREESDPMPPASIPPRSRFQSTFSVRRATLRWSAGSDEMPISIHVLREESDSSECVSMKSLRFQSTFSVRRATGTQAAVHVQPRFQSTFSVRRATPHHA